VSSRTLDRAPALSRSRDKEKEHARGVYLFGLDVYIVRPQNVDLFRWPL